MVSRLCCTALQRILGAGPEDVVGAFGIDQGYMHRGIVPAAGPLHGRGTMTHNGNHSAAHIPDEGGGAVHILEMRLGLRLGQSHFHAGRFLERRRFLLRAASRKKRKGKKICHTPFIHPLTEIMVSAFLGGFTDKQAFLCSEEDQIGFVGVFKSEQVGFPCLPAF